MTVAELIEILKTFPPPMRVVVRGDKGGFDDLAFPGPVNLRLNVNKERFFGPHNAVGPEQSLDAMAIKLIGLRHHQEKSP